MDCLAPGQHGSTFGGNPMATAVGRTALQVIREEGLIENAAEQGRYLLQALKEFRTNSNCRSARARLDDRGGVSTRSGWGAFLCGGVTQ